MLFYPKTKSFHLITLLEKSLIQNRGKNLSLFMLKYSIFNFVNRFNIFRYSNNKKGMELFSNLFREYFYLQELITKYNLEKHSTLTYIIINDIIISDISIGNINNTIIHIEMNINDDINSIYVKTKEKSINITERSLSNKAIKDVFKLLLKTINGISNLYLLYLYEFYIKKGEL